MQVVKAPTDALLTLERTCTSIVSCIMAEQGTLQGSGGEIPLNLNPDLQPRVTLPAKNITLSELQRHRRQFVTVHKKAITLGTSEKGAVDWSEQSVANKFVSYLEENWKS